MQYFPHYIVLQIDFFYPIYDVAYLLRAEGKLRDQHELVVQTLGSVVCCVLLGSGCWVLGVGCWVLGVECWVLVCGGGALNQYIGHIHIDILIINIINK